MFTYGGWRKNTVTLGQYTLCCNISLPCTSVTKLQGTITVVGIREGGILSAVEVTIVLHTIGDTYVLVVLAISSVWV